MATYRELHGKAVKTVTTNPSDDAAEGQIWFNSTDNTFKSAIVAEAWHSSGARITNSIPAGQGGTQTAAWFCGGTPGPGTNTEEYNGSGWSTGGTMSTGRRYGQGWGTQTAAITASGSPMSPPNSGMTATEEYNGTAWTAGTAVPSPYVRYNGAGMGAVQTAGAILCGSQNPPDLNTTLEWNGSSWTGGGNYPFSGPLGTGSAGGTLTAGIAMGGPSQGNVVCKYDGSSWTTTTNYPDSKSRIGVAGTQTAAIGFGGQNSSGTTTNAFLFDGSTFTATGSLGVTNSSGSGHYGMGGSSPSTTTVGMFQGDSATEEFNQSATVITAGAWASGGALPTALRGMGGFGTQTAAISAGGLPPGSGTTSAYSYNGTAWTGIPAIGAANSFMTGSRLSPGSAGSVYGGEPVSSTHQYWDGSSWSEQTDMNSPRYAGGGAGTQTSSLMMGGIPGAPGNTATEEWNGSAWTNQNNAPHGIYNSPGSGSQTAALIFGGNNPAVNTTAEYDGTNWTTSGTMITSRATMGSGGTQTDTIIFGGATSPPTTVTSESEGYDGTSWSTRPSLGTARRALGSAGQTPTALAFGGTTGSDTTATEEFTPESTSLNIETLTQS